MTNYVTQAEVEKLKQCIGKEIGIELLEDTTEFNDYKKTFTRGKMIRGSVCFLKDVNDNGIEIISFPKDPRFKKEEKFSFMSINYFGNFYEIKVITEIKCDRVIIFKRKESEYYFFVSDNILTKWKEYAVEHQPAMDDD